MSRFTISRTFDAPRCLVFGCWVDPVHLANWFGPADCENAMQYADIRPGGYCIMAQSGHKDISFFVKVDFEQIQPIDLIVMVNSFCDESGAFAKHPYLPLWPDKMRAHVSFEEEGAGTKVSVIWDPIDADEATMAFFNEHQWMGQGGWSQSFDRLAATIAGLESVQSA